ncbi:MAG: hypothetical protein KJN99_13400, partial [Marinicaulis sp.]|nr:hypothetical protein [Marinicaulis sp.]
MIRSAIDNGPRGQGLRLIFGEINESNEPQQAISALLARALKWCELVFDEQAKSLSVVAEGNGASPAEVTKQIRLAFL